MGSGSGDPNKRSQDLVDFFEELMKQDEEKWTQIRERIKKRKRERMKMTIYRRDEAEREKKSLN